MADSSNSVASVAIVIIVILALVAFFFIFKPMMTGEKASAPNIEVKVPSVTTGGSNKQ